MLRGTDQGQHLRVVRDLQMRTKTFTYRGQKVKAAVVVDRVTDTKAGRLIEKTVDYFAQDRAGNVYYFGEDVNEYSPGHPVSHEGQWRLGRQTKNPGILMPAHPRVGATYRAERVPGIAVETDRIVADGITETVRGNTYHNVIRVREHATTPKPAEVEFKTYAPGTGVIRGKRRGRPGQLPLKPITAAPRSAPPMGRARGGCGPSQERRHRARGGAINRRR